MQNRVRIRAADGLAANARPARAARTPTPRHPRGGRGHLSAWDTESILELQRLAGNAAVAKSLVGSRRDGRVVMGVDTIKLEEHPLPPAKGIKTIRDMKDGAGILGYTIRSIEDWPPILTPESPSQGTGGWTTKARPVSRVPEPKFKEYWPTQGRHKIADHNYIEVEPDWEKKLHGGEDEHVRDSTHAWEISWRKVADIINGLAKKPGLPQATSDAATKDLWNRYKRALPEDDLRPEGKEPTEDAQRKVLAPDHGTLFRWLFETTVVRDTRGYHEPKMKPVGVGADNISTIEPGKSELPGPLTPDLIKQVRVNFKPGKDIIGS